MLCRGTSVFNRGNAKPKKSLAYARPVPPQAAEPITTVTLGATMPSTTSTPAHRPLARTTSLCLAASLCALMALSGSVQARERHSSGTGARGHTVQHDVSRNQGDVSSSTTGANGATRNRMVDRSATGTSATRTRFNGETSTRETTRTDTGSSTSVTGAHGQSGSVEVNR